jgi:hypothetical protein
MIDAVKADAVQVIKDLDDGGVAYELAAAMDRVLAAVKETGKSGAVALKLKVKPSPELGADVVIISADIAATEPKKRHPGMHRFVTEDGRLAKDDPRQLMFAFAKKEGSEVNEVTK